MLAGDQDFGTIRIGVSTLLVRSELRQALKTAPQTVLLALLDLLARRDAPRAVDAASDPRDPERPHATRSRRAGRAARSAGSRSSAIWAAPSRPSAPSCRAVRRERPLAASPAADFESVVMDNLEDAVALFTPDGELIFSNPAMTVLPQFASAETRRLDDWRRPTIPSGSSSSRRWPRTNPRAPSPSRWPRRSRSRTRPSGNAVRICNPTAWSRSTSIR